jgi:hypothetical protein
MSRAVAAEAGLDARTYSRDEMTEVLAQSKFAFMTPGLGNMYDAAAHDIPTIWLPPANDSQGRQADLLSANGLSDGRVDWADLRSGGKIDYKADQVRVLGQIGDAVSRFTPEVLAEMLAPQFRDAARLSPGKARGLLDRFGTGGDREVARHLAEFGGVELEPEE